MLLINSKRIIIRTFSEEGMRTIVCIDTSEVGAGRVEKTRKLGKLVSTTNVCFQEGNEQTRS